MASQANDTTILEAVLSLDAYNHQADTGNWSQALTNLV